VDGGWQLRPEAAYNIFHFGDFPKVFCNDKKAGVPERDLLLIINFEKF